MQGTQKRSSARSVVGPRFPAAAGNQGLRRFFAAQRLTHAGRALLREPRAGPAVRWVVIDGAKAENVRSAEAALAEAP